MDVKKLLGGALKGLAGIDVNDLARGVITEASAAFSRPHIKRWALGLSAESRRVFSQKFRKLGNALDTEKPDLAELQKRREEIDKRIAALEAGQVPEVVGLEEMADRVADVGADIIDDIKL